MVKIVFLSSFFWAVCCFGRGEEEIVIQCHCVDDCDRSSKCDWIWNEYQLLRSDPNSSHDSLKGVLAEQRVAHFEVVDLGTYGCFTSFGEYEGHYLRIDVGLKFIDKSVVKSSIVEIKKLPSFNEREATSEDDLCLFKLDL
ncbi:hypothetical protein [Gynuella sunshinyii]|uniref:hypothetical protein n=1 Tax=Gynuella sunshinyii TaxID=1445505 RepID=UPI0005CBA0C1|nr:hypothetical protein [Gynuella sunshinyii]